MKTAIIIPSRMSSQRFPNKPMAKINGIPMIERVWKQGINSKIGEVYVACCEDEVFDLISSKGGKAIMTDPNLPSGTDRVFAAFNLLDNKDEYESIINLQGDMPLIDSINIQSVNSFANNAFAYVGPQGGAFGTQFEGLASYTDFTNSNNLARGNQTIGFNRYLDNDSMLSAAGCTICNFFQKDMVIRPQICANGSGTANIYGVNHSHWSIVYLGR